MNRETWWLDTSGFPDLLWARLRVFVDGSADVLDLDGKVHRFRTEQDARFWLAEDEYVSLESIEDDELTYAALTREELVPPSALRDSDIVPKMFVRRSI